MKDATIYLYDTIGEYTDAAGNLCQGVSGREIAEAIAHMQDIAERITLRINSPGGSVFEGYTIISAMQESKIPVDCVIDGLAASMAGLIAVCATGTRKMRDYAILMIHNPKGGDQKLVDLVQKKVTELLTKAGNASEKTVAKLMDEETWFDSSEALKMGFVDEIIAMPEKVTVDKANAYAAFEVFNAILPKSNEMEDTNPTVEKTEQLEHVQQANVADLTAQLDELKNAFEALKGEKEKLESELKKINDEKQAAEDRKVHELVNAYVTSGRIPKEDKDKYVALAKVDFNTVAKTLDMLNAHKAINVFNAAEVKTPTGKDAWTIRDWEKQDPAGLYEMKKQTPELYDRLFKAFYQAK